MSGLRPQTRYTIRLTVLNGVSDQDSAGEEGRRSEVMATTGVLSMFCDIELPVPTFLNLDTLLQDFLECTNTFSVRPDIRGKFIFCWSSERHSELSPLWKEYK